MPANANDINALFQSTLGRSADKGGLDYYSKMAEEKGIDWVKNSLAGSDEAQVYKQRGSGLTVAKNDQVKGLSYRNSSNVAAQSAKDQSDYGLLSSNMQKGVELGRFTTEQGDGGQTLYRSQNGGLYTVTGAPAQQQTGPARTTVNRNQTSAGQLDDILASNSPLMQRAAMQGQQYANARGLLNSSMAAEAAQGAMIDRATPLAQQDAQTYFQNSQANADRQQQAYMANLNYQNQRGLNEQGYQFDMGRMQADYGFSSQLSTQEASQTLNQLYATSTANAWGVMANNLTDIVGQYSAQLERIQTNPDIEEADKATLIEQVLAMRDTDINFQRSLYEQLPTYLANTGVFPNR